MCESEPRSRYPAIESRDPSTSARASRPQGFGTWKEVVLRPELQECKSSARAEARARTNVGQSVGPQPYRTRKALVSRKASVPLPRRLRLKSGMQRRVSSTATPNPSIEGTHKRLRLLRPPHVMSNVRALTKLRRIRWRNDSAASKSAFNTSQLQVLKQQPAALLLSGQRGLNAKAKHHRPGGEGSLIPSRLPHGALVQLRRWCHPPPLAAFVYSYWPTGPDTSERERCSSDQTLARRDAITCAARTKVAAASY